jgi:hypothetical protein
MLSPQIRRALKNTAISEASAGIFIPSAIGPTFSNSPTGNWFREQQKKFAADGARAEQADVILHLPAEWAQTMTP